MNENKIELQDNRDSLSEGEPVTIRCPWCESGSVQVDSPIALYVGRTVTVSCCDKCGALQEDQPSARLNEVIEAGLPVTLNSARGDMPETL